MGTMIGHHIVHVLDSCDPQAGSTALAVRGLIEALKCIGVESSTLTIRNSVDPGEGISPEHSSGLGSTSGGKRRFDGNPASFPTGHVVHFHGWDPKSCRAIARQCAQKREPIVISPLGSLCDGPGTAGSRLKSWRFRWSDRPWLRRAAAVTAICRLEKEQLDRQRLNRRIEVLEYGVESNAAGAVDRLPKPSGPRVVLLLGPIDVTRGAVLLLKTFAELATESEGWSVVMAGPVETETRKSLEAAIRRKGGADRVRIDPLPDESAQREWLHRADLLVDPSLTPVPAVSILLALSHGIPVVAAGHQVPLTLTEAAWVCDPTRDGLRAALRAALRCTDEERIARGRWGRERVARDWDWRVVAPRFAKLYASVVNGHEG